MTSHNPEDRRLETVSFGDVVEFATLDSLSGGSPVALVARFVVTELIDGSTLSAAKIRIGADPECVSMFGTMEPPVRKIGGVEPWGVDRIWAAMQWFIGSSPNKAQLREDLERRAMAQPIEYPTF